MIRDPRIEEARLTVMSWPRNKEERPDSRYISMQAMVTAGLSNREIMDRVPGLDWQTVQVCRMVTALPPIGGSMVSIADIMRDKRLSRQDTRQQRGGYEKHGKDIVRLLDKGMTAQEVRRELGCSAELVRYWVKKFEKMLTD